MSALPFAWDGLSSLLWGVTPMSPTYGDIFKNAPTTWISQGRQWFREALHTSTMKVFMHVPRPFVTITHELRRVTFLHPWYVQATSSEGEGERANERANQRAAETTGDVFLQLHYEWPFLTSLPLSFQGRRSRGPHSLDEVQLQLSRSIYESLGDQCAFEVLPDTIQPPPLTSHQSVLNVPLLRVSDLIRSDAFQAKYAAVVERATCLAHALDLQVQTEGGNPKGEGPSMELVNGHVESSWMVRPTSQLRLSNDASDSFPVALSEFQRQMMTEFGFRFTVSLIHDGHGDGAQIRLYLLEFDASDMEDLSHLITHHIAHHRVKNVFLDHQELDRYAQSSFGQMCDEVRLSTYEDRLHRCWEWITSICASTKALVSRYEILFEDEGYVLRTEWVFPPSMSLMSKDVFWHNVYDQMDGSPKNSDDWDPNTRTMRTYLHLKHKKEVVLTKEREDYKRILYEMRGLHKEGDASVRRPFLDVHIPRWFDVFLARRSALLTDCTWRLCYEKPCEDDPKPYMEVQVSWEDVPNERFPRFDVKASLSSAFLSMTADHFNANLTFPVDHTLCLQTSLP